MRSYLGYEIDLARLDNETKHTMPYIQAHFIRAVLPGRGLVDPNEEANLEVEARRFLLYTFVDLTHRLPEEDPNAIQIT